MRKSPNFSVITAALLFGLLAMAEGRPQCPLGGCPPGPAATPAKPKPKPKPKEMAVAPPKAPVKPIVRAAAHKPAAPVAPPVEKPATITEKPPPAGNNAALPKGALTVLADAKSAVRLTREGGQAEESPGPRSAQFVTFNNLARGRYTVVAELEGIRSEPLTVEVQAGETKTVDLRLTGALLVAARPKTNITVKAQGQVTRQGIVPESGSISFADLVNNRYEVTAQLEGFQTVSQEAQVVAQTTATVSLPLAPVTYNVTLALNAANGRVMFQNSAETAKWEMYQFQNSRATIANLPAGSYRLVVEPDDASYQRKTLTLKVPSGEGAVAVSLDKKLSEEAFAPQQTEDWSIFGAPWEAKDGKILLKGAGIALPGYDKFRHYSDFSLWLQARLLNNESVSFVLRAADEKNYYRVELNGPKAEKPLGLRGYIMREGVERPFAGHTASLIPYTQLLGSGKPFYVWLTMVGQSILVNISENLQEKGVEMSLKADGDLAAGAVGLANNSSGKVEIKSFRVQPATPPTP